jgi:cholesterol transport system auxiliary component
MSRTSVVKDTFLLEVQRSGTAVVSGSKAILSVQPFSIAPAFERNSIVSRVDENEYVADYYNEYFVSPAMMVTNQTRQWLVESHLFAHVLSPSSIVQPTHILEGHVMAMFLDQSNIEQPLALLKISFYLVKKHKRDETITFHKTYTVTRSMQSTNTQAYAAAQTAALTEILQAIETDLATILENTD